MTTAEKVNQLYEEGRKQLNYQMRQHSFQWQGLTRHNERDVLESLLQTIAHMIVLSQEKDPNA